MILIATPLSGHNQSLQSLFRRHRNTHETAVRRRTTVHKPSILRILKRRGDSFNVSSLLRKIKWTSRSCCQVDEVTHGPPTMGTLIQRNSIKGFRSGAAHPEMAASLCQKWCSATRFAPRYLVIIEHLLRDGMTQLESMTTEWISYDRDWKRTTIEQHRNRYNPYLLEPNCDCNPRSTNDGTRLAW